MKPPIRLPMLEAARILTVSPGSHLHLLKGEIHLPSPTISTRIPRLVRPATLLAITRQSDRKLFYECCNKNGHLSVICIDLLPWECTPAMCAFQSRGRGFYYIHDYNNAKQIEDQSSSIVITIAEESATGREVEHEFCTYLGAGLRCTARVIGLN